MYWNWLGYFMDEINIYYIYIFTSLTNYFDAVIGTADCRIHNSNSVMSAVREILDILIVTIYILNPKYLVIFGQILRTGLTSQNLQCSGLRGVLLGLAENISLQLGKFVVADKFVLAVESDSCISTVEATHDSIEYWCTHQFKTVLCTRCEVVQLSTRAISESCLVSHTLNLIHEEEVAFRTGLERKIVYH